MPKFTTLLIFFVAILSTLLLVGNRVGYRWAGGEGYQKHQEAWLYTNVKPWTFSRGEIVSTMPNSELIQPFFVHGDSGQMASNFEIPLLLHLGDSMIILDENTEVKILDGREGRETIQLIQGRIIVKGDLSVFTRDIQTNINGLTSIVHYGWLDRIDLANSSGTINVYVSEADEIAEVLENKAITLSTLSPHNPETINFDTNSSSASEFYTAACQTLDVCF
ncbi:MAG: hypothetical protein ABH826_04185 [Patescibacteria group bacterium]|nr:hypothetical protein [Patescibacteria group bacterium]